MISPRLAQKIAFFLLGLCMIIVITPVLIILSVIVVKGWPAISWEFLSSMPRMGMKAGGIFPAIVGTFYLVAVTMFLATPLGIMAAIYLVEYAKDNWLKRLVEIAIVNLAGVPSIVFGLFGMGLFVIFLKFGVSILAGAMTLAVLTLPVIITATKEALARVPQSFREVSLSLGATRWQTIRHAVLPNAVPGILTGTILEVSRAAGETAPILFTVAAFYLPKLAHSLFDQVMALPYHLYVLSTQVPNVKPQTQYGTALVLVGLVLILNLFAMIIRARFRKRKKW